MVVQHSQPCHFVPLPGHCMANTPQGISENKERPKALHWITFSNVFATTHFREQSTRNDIYSDTSLMVSNVFYQLEIMEAHALATAQDLLLASTNANDCKTYQHSIPENPREAVFLSVLFRCSFIQLMTHQNLPPYRTTTPSQWALIFNLECRMSSPTFL